MTRIILESVPRFVRDNDEDDWQTTSSGREPLDYTQGDLDQMLATAIELSFHPGGRGLLEAMESFVVGEGAYMLADDENPEVQDYWNGWEKANQWDLRSKEAFRRFLRDGEVFLRWFPSMRNEKPHYPLTRFLEPNEIKPPAGDTEYSFGIKCSPKDVEQVLEYHREYAVGATVTTELIDAAEIDHFKALVDSNVKRGRSWLLGCAKYIVMHERWIDQRFQLNRLRNLFAVIGNVTGIGGNDLSNLKAKFGDTTGKTVSGEGTPKKLPTNAMMLLQKGVEWDLKGLNINASDAAEDGRNIQLLICVGTGLTEYIVRGDSSNSNFASTLVSESPMVKMFLKWRDLWRNHMQTIFRRVIRYGIDTEQLAAMSTRTQEGQRRNTLRRLRIALAEGRKLAAESARAQLRLIEGKDKTEKVPTSVECQVEFPPLIHRDIKTETEALAVQRSQGWVSDRTASTTLGYDYDKEAQELQAADDAAYDRAKKADHENWS
jgi:hypothetical protein